MTGRAQWYRLEELGVQAIGAGAEVAVRCRVCGMRFEYSRASKIGERCDTCAAAADLRPSTVSESTTIQRLIAEKAVLREALADIAHLRHAPNCDTERGLCVCPVGRAEAALDEDHTSGWRTTEVCAGCGGSGTVRLDLPGGDCWYGPCEECHLAVTEGDE